METEVRTLKQELTRTRDALRLATKRCRDLVGDLDSRTLMHENERCLRDQQLSRILRALLVLESRLKQEQKSIRQLLCEKDNVIRNQQLEIARLRRYTKNYIKSKREQTRNGGQSNTIELSSLSSGNFDEDDDGNVAIVTTKNRDSRGLDAENKIHERIGNELGNDIQRLKREIIDKFNDEERAREIANDARNLKERQTSIFGVRKTNSFAGSDVSKESCASSGENTDGGSILTTTTDESSPSLLSTEGFCEGESTDCSPGSTLNKSSTKSFGPGIKRIINESGNHETRIDDIHTDDTCAKRRNGVVHAKPIEIFFNDPTDGAPTISRSDSKDDGMDCNFASDDENLDDIHEPIYVNACNENNARNSRDRERKNFRGECATKKSNFDNNNGPSKMVHEEDGLMEDTSGNWYSDPDEDRISDEVFRHSTYRPNGNHNSVLECVNQILLRDMEEEDSVLSAPRRFKHRGRIVRFQPARLSDIESVGSEMERRNSDDCSATNDRGENANENAEMGNFEATASEDEFGMRIDQSVTSVELEKIEVEEKLEKLENVAIPIIVIEPKIDSIDLSSSPRTSSMEISCNRGRNRSASPTRRMEIIEEKKCLQMSTKGLTIAKNLDYEDIESLPEIIQPLAKTPPALPPKPTQFRSTLVLKKIPSPSFLIDETRAKNSQRKIDAENLRLSSGGINDCLARTRTNGFQARSLVFEDKYSPAKVNDNETNERNKFSRSSLSSLKSEKNLENSRTPRVTSIVRHFEEFKIGTDDICSRSKERNRPSRDFDDFDMRQNFEEFNLDDCDLSDDTDRPETDGSDRLTSNIARQLNDENSDNNNVSQNGCPIVSTAGNSNGIYDNFLEATGLSNKSILTPSRLLSNHKSMLKPKDVKYKNRIKSNAIGDKSGLVNGNNGQFTQVRHWTGPFV